MTTNNAAGNATAPAGIRNWATPGETPAASRPATPVAGNDMATKEVFLQMLVAQIKNQNPLNPMDGVEFLSQLSQFTQVEQTLGMRDDIRKLTQLLEQQRAAPKANPPAANPPAANPPALQP